MPGLRLCTGRMEGCGTRWEVVAGDLVGGCGIGWRLGGR